MEEVVINITELPNDISISIIDDTDNVVINITEGISFSCSDLASCQTIIDIEANINSVSSDLSSHESNTNNPHNVTKAQVGLSNVDNTSDINKPVSTAQQTALNLKEDKANKVTNFNSPNNTDYATTQATINLVDNRVQSNIKIIGDWDATSGSMPLDDESNTTPFITQWGATIKVGWAFRVGYGQAGTVGGFDYEEGDVVYALIDNAGPTPADWGDLDHNLQQADESLRGTAKVITAAIISDETTTDDERFVTGKKLWLNFWTRVLAIAHTFAAKITFTTAPRFNSTTASQYLKVDASKDLTSVSAIPATDVTEDSTHRFITDAERLKWNKFSYCDGTLGLVSVTNTLTISQYVLIPANTFTPGQNQSIEVQLKARKTGSNSFCFLYFYINTSLSLSGAQQLGGINTSGNNTHVYLGISRVIPIQSGSFDYQNNVLTTTGDDNLTSTNYATATIDWTVDQYVMNVVRANAAADNLRGTFLRVTEN